MISFLDLKKINDSFEPDLTSAIYRVMSSGWYLLGNEVNTFEQQYGAFIGSKYCITVANGLDALRLIFRSYIEMKVMDVGDEIIVPANTFIASILAVTENHLKPVFVEPDVDTYNIDVSLIEKHITARTKGILVVHLYGRACWSEELDNLARKYDLRIIEDNAQAAGASVNIDDQGTIKMHRTGSLGNAAGHSFYPGKNLGAIGDGGAVTTDDENLACVLRSMANYGASKKYIHEYQGLNSRLDEIQAAILKVKLPRLDTDNQMRRKIARFYYDNITNPEIYLPGNRSPGSTDENSKSYIIEALDNVWHLFVIRNSNRDKLQAYLHDNGVQTLIHYPVPPHKQKAYSEFNQRVFPVTEQLHREVLSLPISPVLSDSEVEFVAEVINKYKG